LQSIARLSHLLFVPIWSPRPEEAFHTVAPAARYDVNVQMRNALAHFIVYGDERALSPKSQLDSLRDHLRPRE
jgi:hypothetical protein